MNTDSRLSCAFQAHISTRSRISAQSALAKGREVSLSTRALLQKGGGYSKLDSITPYRKARVSLPRAVASAATQQAEERVSSNAQASTSDAEPLLTRKQSQESVADKLIDLFAAKSPLEWRKLIAFSKQWASLSDG